MLTGGLHSPDRSGQSLSRWLEKGLARDRLIVDWSGRAFSAMLLRGGGRPEPCVFDINGALWRFVSSHFHVSEKEFAESGDLSLQKLAAALAHLPETAANALKDMEWLAAWDADSKSLDMPHRDPLRLLSLLESSGADDSGSRAMEHFIGALFAFAAKPLFAFLHRNDVHREGLDVAVIVPAHAGFRERSAMAAFFSGLRFGRVTVLDDATALAMNFAHFAGEGETERVLVLTGHEDALIARVVGFSFGKNRLEAGIMSSGAFPGLGTRAFIDALARSLEKRAGQGEIIDRTRLDNAFFALGCGASSPMVSETSGLGLTHGLLQEMLSGETLSRWMGEASGKVSDFAGSARFGSVVTHNGIFMTPCLGRAVLSGAGLPEPYRVRSIVCGERATAGVLRMLRLKEREPDLDLCVAHRLGISVENGHGGVLPVVPARLMPMGPGQDLVIHRSLEGLPDPGRALVLKVLWGDHPVAALNPVLAHLHFPPSPAIDQNGYFAGLSFHLKGGGNGVTGTVGGVLGTGREVREPLLFP